MANVKNILVFAEIISVYSSASGGVGFQNTVGVTGHIILFETNSTENVRLSLKRCVEESCPTKKIIETKSNVSQGYFVRLSANGYYEVGINQLTYGDAGIYTLEIAGKQGGHSSTLDVVDDPPCEVTISVSLGSRPNAGHIYKHVCTVMHSGLRPPQVRFSWQKTWCRTRSEARNHFCVTVCEVESHERLPSESCIVEYNNDSVFGSDVYRKAPELDKSSPAFVGSCAIRSDSYVYASEDLPTAYASLSNMRDVSPSPSPSQTGVSALWGLAAFVGFILIVIVLIVMVIVIRFHPRCERVRRLFEPQNPRNHEEQQLNERRDGQGQ